MRYVGFLIESPTGTSKKRGTGAVFGISHSEAESQEINEALDVALNGAPVDFNGNDSVGLFKNGTSINIIGLEGGTDFGKDQTFRRKLTFTSPNTTYTADEWEVLEKDTADGLGTY